jgi:hypothetical protein
VHDERVEVVSQALGGGGIAGRLELLDQGPQSLLAVALVDSLIKRLPVGRSDSLALPLGQLGEQVANAVYTAVLAVRGGASTARLR